MQCLRYGEGLQKAWDGFVRETSWNGTFLHMRRFLSYHGDRFDDASLLLNDEVGRLVAVFPAAFHQIDRDTVVSHPGATFGGMVAGGRCRGEDCVEALSTTVEHYRAMGVRRLLYKAVPHIYHRIPYQDDLYALFRLGFRRVRCDLSATIATRNRLALTKGRKYEIAKARKHGVVFTEGEGQLKDIYGLIEANLFQAHRTRPVHAVSELALLQSRFPDNVRLMAVRMGGEAVGGLVMFNSERVAHTQYIASNERGRESGALDSLVEYSIGKAFAENYDYFDFGISNEKDGQILNEGLYRYKRTFGAGSVVHEFYELML